VIKRILIVLGVGVGVTVWYKMGSLLNSWFMNASDPGLYEWTRVNDPTGWTIANMVVSIAAIIALFLLYSAIFLWIPAFWRWLRTGRG